MGDNLPLCGLGCHGIPASLPTNPRTVVAPETNYAWLCQQIVEGIPDALIFADENGIIRLWNGGAEALFGFTATEAIGQRLDLIIPERLRERNGMATGGLWQRG